MTGQYKGNDLQWRPIATSEVEPPPDIVVSRVGAVSECGYTRNAGDAIWAAGELDFNISDMTYFFYGLSRITRVPDSLGGVTATNTAAMFQNCWLLASVPLFNTAAVANMGAMFQNCSSLTSLPLFDTSAATNMNFMLSGCASLTEVPALNMAGPTSFTNTFGSAGTVTTTQLRSCTRFRAYGATRGFAINGTLMNAAALDELMGNLGAAAGAQTLDLRYNPGSATCDTSIATAKGWTVVTA